MPSRAQVCATQSAASAVSSAPRRMMKPRETNVSTSAGVSVPGAVSGTSGALMKDSYLASAALRLTAAIGAISDRSDVCSAVGKLTAAPPSATTLESFGTGSP